MESAVPQNDEVYSFSELRSLQFPRTIESAVPQYDGVYRLSERRSLQLLGAMEPQFLWTTESTVSRNDGVYRITERRSLQFPKTMQSAIPRNDRVYSFSERRSLQFLWAMEPQFLRTMESTVSRYLWSHCSEWRSDNRSTNSNISWVIKVGSPKSHLHNIASYFLHVSAERHKNYYLSGFRGHRYSHPYIHRHPLREFCHNGRDCLQWHIKSRSYGIGNYAACWFLHVYSSDLN